MPAEVRRHVLEASVRSPAHWHWDAVRAAYRRADRDWRLTAVLAMSHVRGFGDQIIAALDDPDAEIAAAAMDADDAAAAIDDEFEDAEW